MLKWYISCCFRLSPSEVGYSKSTNTSVGADPLVDDPYETRTCQVQGGAIRPEHFVRDNITIMTIFRKPTFHAQSITCLCTVTPI